MLLKEGIPKRSDVEGEDQGPVLRIEGGAEMMYYSLDGVFIVVITRNQIR